MKYFFICTILLQLVVKVSFAQTFSLSELIKLRTLSYANFEISVNNKGYQFVKVKDVNGTQVYSFAIDDRNGLSTRFIRYEVDENNKGIHVSYQTSFIYDYRILKDSAIKSGFSHLKSGTFESAVYTKYKKENRVLTFFSGRGINGSGIDAPVYEISVD